jgi:hypothetical protein
MPLSVRCVVVNVLWFIAILAIAAAGGIAAILAFTLDTEAIWFGIGGVLFVVPSILLYGLLDWWRSHAMGKHLGFSVPIVAAVASFLAYYVYLRSTSDPDGAHEIIMALVVAILGSACAAAVGLCVRRRMAG